MTRNADIEAQHEREAALRQASLGRRVKAVEAGHLAPVLRRWVNADVAPMADILREVAGAYIAGDMKKVACMLGQPTAELSQRERPLLPLMQWSLRDGNAEDLCLAFMGTVIPTLCASSDGGVSLSSILANAAALLRDTVQGQFITSVQGAPAMQRLRSTKPELWNQRKSLKRIAGQLRAQVKPQFLAESRGEIEIPTRGHRKVLSVTDYKGDLRRLELLRTPDETDWQIMDLCWHPDDNAGSHRHLNLWVALATMFLSIAQQTSGWFEVSQRTTESGKRKKTTKVLSLSEDAHAAITRDTERWIGSGFVCEPMLVPPEDGDFLTVKHKKVTGQRPPKGLITRPDDTFAWREGACGLATTSWTVNEHAVSSPLLDMEDPYTAMKVASHRRLGQANFYLPVNMDFRGRIYYRTPWVTPQSSDLGKSLLAFPSSFKVQMPPRAAHALAMHISALGGMDKQPREERLAFTARVTHAVGLTADILEAADSPLTLHAHHALLKAGEWDRIPIQLDGTCNGLQHLSALSRDEVGARFVNLTEGGDTPSDIYGVVARRVEDCIQEAYQGTAPMWVGGGQEPWMERLRMGGLKIDRKLCKSPVMVLPYGGTLEAIRRAVKASVLDQMQVGENEVVDSPWNRYEADGYGAFRNRALSAHPLFNKDVTQLAFLIHSCIKPVIPKAMDLMAALHGIAKWLGPRAIAWMTGPEYAPMWVYQAKSKSARKQVTMRGYQLPDIIRRLTLVQHTDEVDPKAHRSGIVANFVHSLDAEHMARTVARFRELGGGCVGGIHDCVMVRPSEAHLMHRALRGTFREMYELDPLSRPVRVISTEGLDAGAVTEYSSWYELAEAAGVVFPERGTWQPAEVMDSEWFFS